MPSYKLDGTMLRHARVSIPLAIALVAAACGKTQPVTLEPVYRLVHERETELPAGAPRACVADDEIRPAFGCVVAARLKAAAPLETVESNAEPGIRARRRRYRIPPALVGQLIVIEPSFRVRERRGWNRLPRHVQSAPTPEVDIVFPIPADAEALDVNAWALRIPPQQLVTRTKQTHIPAGAILSFGIAIAPAGAETASSPVEFRLTAETSAGERELFRQILDPSTPDAFTWSDHRLDLAALRGENARFRFSTQVISPDGASTRGAFSFPLWGAPQILAPRPRGRQRNVILISLDTLRADHVGAYGSELPTTPEIDRFAADAALFEHAITAYSATPQSHMTMLTGLYPSAHGVTGPFKHLSPSIPTLTELLAANGYQTGAVTENAMLVPASGFQRGFSFYRENKRHTIWDVEGDIQATFDAGLAWLEAHRQERFFLFLHTYEVHEPYDPPPAFDLFKTYHHEGRDIEITEETPWFIRARHAYAGETRYVDSEFRRLWDGLVALGQAEQTLVILTSDHGEEFLDHGWKGHNETVYDEVLRVPLIMRAPGLVPAGVRIPVQVSLVDLMPTVLDLVGLPVPEAIQGKSLAPLLRDPNAPGFADRPVFAEVLKRKPTGRAIAARTNARKWIFYEGMDRSPEVYDLSTDPTEQRNIASPELVSVGEALVRDYNARNAAWRARLVGEAASPAALVPRDVDSRTVEKLKALGYVDAAREAEESKSDTTQQRAEPQGP